MQSNGKGRDPGWKKKKFALLLSLQIVCFFYASTAVPPNWAQSNYVSHARILLCFIAWIQLNRVLGAWAADLADQANNCTMSVSLAHSGARRKFGAPGHLSLIARLLPDRVFALFSLSPVLIWARLPRLIWKLRVRTTEHYYCVYVWSVGHFIHAHKAISKEKKAVGGTYSAYRSA